jgi:hypothetical protein
MRLVSSLFVLVGRMSQSPVRLKDGLPAMAFKNAEIKPRDLMQESQADRRNLCLETQLEK